METKTFNFSQEIEMAIITLLQCSVIKQMDVTDLFLKLELEPNNEDGKLYLSENTKQYLNSLQQECKDVLENMPENCDCSECDCGCTH